MKLLSALIVDDEVHGRNNIINLLTTHCPEVIVAGSASDADEAAQKIKEHNPDVVFLDIMMPGMSGLDLLGSMPDCSFATVMVTAYSDFGIKAIKCGVVDYLLKPIDIIELKKCIPKIHAFHSKYKSGTVPKEEDLQRVIAVHATGFDIIDLKNIVYMEANGNYTNVQLVSGENLLVCRTLKDFADTISLKDFFRIQRSFLINLNHVKQYLNAEAGSVVMADNRQITVSISRSEEFFELLKRQAIFPGE